MRCTLTRGCHTTSSPITAMATMCVEYAVSASAPVAASGYTASRQRSATTRQVTSTSSATPMLPVTSNVESACGSVLRNASTLSG